MAIKGAPFDRYTAAHAMLGGVLGLWGAPFIVALGTSLVFEHYEDALKRIAPRLFPVGKPDTRQNTAADTIAFMAGWGVTKLLPPQPAKIWAKWP